MNRTRSLIALLAVVTMIASACSSDDVASTASTTTAVPIEITTTTTAVDVGAQSLAWSEVFEVPDPYTITTLVSAHGRFYALGHDHETDNDAPPMVWASEDGTEWYEIATTTFGSGAIVRELVGSEQGVLALGLVPAREGHSATAWFSTDGVDWEVSDLGYLVEPTEQPYTTNEIWYSAAAVEASGALVAANASRSVDWAAIQQAAWEVLPDDFDSVALDRVQSTPETVTILVGPFALFSESYESLGLDDVHEAWRLANSGPTMEEHLTFATSDFENWSVDDGNPMGAAYVPAIVALDGEFVALAGTMSGGARVHSTRDGQNWEPIGELVDGGGLYDVGGRLIADGWRGSQRVMLVSDDGGLTWEDLPGPDVNGSWIAATGPAGVLATGTEGEVGWGATPEPSTIERDGYTITLDSAMAEFSVADSGGSTLVSAQLMMEDPMWGWGFSAPEELVFDFSTETAAVIDPATGETLVILTFDDLDRFESGMVDYGGELVLFTADLEEWTATPMAEAFGEKSMLTASSVGNDRVVAAVAGIPAFPTSLDDQSIWVGVPVAGDPTPTNQPVSEAPPVAMDGPALAWEMVPDLEGLDVDSLLVKGSDYWAVVGVSDGPNGLWTSFDGGEWSEVDTAALLGEGASVDTLVSGGPGLVAVGFLPAGDTREAVAWTSSDGETWSVSPLGYKLPTPKAPATVTEFQIRQVAAGPQGAVIAASTWEGFDWDRLEPNVAAALPVALQPFATGMGAMIDPWQISVTVGPFEVFSETVDNLDVDHNLFEAYQQSISRTGPEMVLFATQDYETWQQADDWPGGDNNDLSALTATDDGYLASTWTWGTGVGPYESSDGLAWEETELAANHGTIHWFGNHDERLLMLAEPDSTLWESEDGGTTWTRFSALPPGAHEVWTGGMGLIAWGEHESAWWDPTNWAPTVIDSGGFTLTAQAGKDGFSVADTSGTPVVTADLYGEPGPGGFSLPPFVEVDHDRGLFTVTDPTFGGTLMTLTYGEMQAAYDNAQGSAGIGPDTFVAYSADGTRWSEQRVGELTGAAGWVGPIAVGVDNTVLVVRHFDGSLSLWRGTMP